MIPALDVLARHLHVAEGDAGGWVTYRPFLVRALLWAFGTAPEVHVLELGTGVGSSPMLAELAAFSEGLSVTAVETDPHWYAETQALVANAPHYTLVKTLPDLGSVQFDVVFVDHGPVEARARDLSLLASNKNVGLVVVHDWNCDVYCYDKAIFKHRVEDCGRWPNTAILSNTVDLSSWLGYEK